MRLLFSLALFLASFGIVFSPPSHQYQSPFAPIVRSDASFAISTTTAIKRVEKAAPIKKRSHTAPTVDVATTANTSITSVMPTRAATAAPAPIPTSQPEPAAPPQQDIASYIRDLTNAERAKQGLSKLAVNTVLDSVAREHSRDMLDNNYFSHIDPRGCSSSCRATNGGYAWRAIGENIYMMEGYDVSAHESAQMVVRGWMNSPEHRANILGTQYEEMGVGVVQSGETIYVTGMYGTSL